MNCIIIEDEENSIEYLELMLKMIDPSIIVKAKIGSVENAVKWLRHKTTDLIFLDVHLGDDTSFSIFERMEIDTPVIFTTAYDDYAIKAFKLNSISYLLKPIEEAELREAIEKLKHLKGNMPDLRSLLNPGTNYQKRFLVNYGRNNMKFLTDEEIAYIKTHNRNLFITCTDGKQYIFYGSMDSMEQKLDAEKFFRINRNYIVSVNSIKDMQSLSRGRIKVDILPKHKENIIVSVDRSSEFKKWLNH